MSTWCIYEFANFTLILCLKYAWNDKGWCLVLTELEWSTHLRQTENRSKIHLSFIKFLWICIQKGFKYHPSVKVNIYFILLSFVQKSFFLIDLKLTKINRTTSQPQDMISSCLHFKEFQLMYAKKLDTYRKRVF